MRGPVCVLYVGDCKHLCLFVCLLACLFVGGARREIGHKRAKPTALIRTDTTLDHSQKAEKV